MNGDHVSVADSDNMKSPLLPVVHNDEPLERNTMGQHLRTIFTPNNCYIALGPLLCAVVCLCARLGGDDTTRARNMLGVLVWIFEWWLTEAVPMPITSMSPLFLFPLFGITAADEVASSYMDDVIALVLGSFILALAVEHYNIHRRLALNVSRFISLFSLSFSHIFIESFVLYRFCKHRFLMVDSPFYALEKYVLM